MYSATQINMLRDLDSGAPLPGIDTEVGNLQSESSLETPSSIPTTSSNQPFYYDPSKNTVFVQQAGAVLNGYDFGSANVVVVASDVTIENCTFDGTGGSFAIGAYNTAWSPATTDTTVTHCTFVGDPSSSLLAVINSPTGSATITDNAFLDTAGDGVWADGGGLISGNYFSQAGNDGAAGHPDGIWLSNSTSPMTVSDNFIDWSQNPAATGSTNDCIRITGELGPVSNVTVTGNFLLNGATSISAVDGSGPGALSDIAITGNYLVGPKYYTFFPGSMSGSTVSGNVIADQTSLSDAWAAYQAAGVPTATLLASTDGSAVSAASATAPTTLYADVRNTLMVGGPNETNFVSGYASQNMWAGSGADIFTYLATGDSSPAAADYITNFDPAKDVIDLSRVDANPGGAPETFAFIGANAFDGAGPEIRTQAEADGDTIVQVALAGDTTPDMQIILTSSVPLTAANFAVTAAQSQAAIANGADMGFSVTSGWPLTETTYANVQGRPYSDFTSFRSGSYLVADALDLGGSSDEIDLFGKPGAAVTITRGDGAEQITSAGKTDSLAFHANETIAAGAAPAGETFAIGPGSGNVTIEGFAASGANADRLQLSASAFSGLQSGMTDAEKLAAALGDVSTASGGASFTDSAGDRLTLVGVAPATLTANPGLVKFV
ncbi:peptidase M10/serralysin-like protein [Roseiarcus fermentans]|uniref:Peptidase M10/serralysin-like protein n=1 Tax=Roseiarcus fermentans TaxID=1473586 RepID=A0A366F0S7_9HYPH|nr:M10 family metallopeptidase C-terminal domain-containing protein [Roseiarcus fermentans]RBP08241.1 peptidase M10/serralysin-like protein [Roseiarcus fermentans]